MSPAMNLTRALLHARPNVFRTERTLREALRHPRPDAPLPANLRRTCAVRTETVDGREVITLTPRRGATGTEVIYLHGGAYVRPLVAAHWRIVAALIRRTGATVTVPLYGLAPRYTADDAYRFLDMVYRAVLQRAGAHPVFLAGDSCGAGLAVGQAIRCRDEGLRPPAGLILFSPWVDVTMTNPGIARLTAHDPMLAPEGLAAAGRDWAGPRAVTDPLISPLHDTLADLPPTWIYQGGHDIFLPDAEAFAAKANAAGTPTTLHVWPSAFHVFVGAGWTPEARRALADAAGRIRAAGRG
ncbi:alpha/beta hydrolase fold domain-containing protein [Streptomyces sp. NRRL F-2799]|uniref:alpha/beta hydrolase fold domain-containing protein n=1 Tax=Streptomyces sp. NRRL F-2799 TaxID=1463844 RepID=UPI0006922CE2|nr:alpha/beta hydrolase fold domain-containing protein [Streptomyces sp. NRRL F-2799]